MDASSIITQVSRDDEQLNPLPQTDKVAPQNGKKPRKNVFRNLFCCCFAEPEVQSLGSNGTCVTDDGSSISQTGQIPQPVALPTRFLLPPISHRDMHKKCMVIDLDETLVHSSFKPISNADFIVPVEIDGTVHQVYVLKRPYVDEFLQKMGELYECVLFTASLAKYADPVANLLDKRNVFRARLFRESCVFHRGNYVKDLSRLGRDLQKIVIMDNSPASYTFHPNNAVPVSSWFDDMGDTELLDLIPFLDTLSRVDNVYTVLQECNKPIPSPLHPAATTTAPFDGMMSTNSPLNQGPITQIQQPTSLPLLQGPSTNPYITNTQQQVNGSHQGSLSVLPPTSAVVSSGSGIEGGAFSRGSSDLDSRS